MAGYTPQGLAGNSPQNVSTPTTYNFLGAVALNNFAVLRPDVNPDLTKRYGPQEDIVSMFEKLGLTRRITGSSIYRHYEEERLMAPVVLAATTGGQGNGVTLTVNIATTDVFDIDQEAPYIGTASTEAVVPQVNDTGFFANNVEAVVTAVAADGSTFDATPVQVDQEIPTVSDGDEFIIMGRANKESSTKGTSVTGRVIYYQNNVQILRSDQKITGTAIGEDTWINFDGKYGSGPHWFYYDMDRFFKRHKQYISNQMLIGNEVTNPALAAISGFETVKKTKGLIPTVEDSGISESYVADSMDLDDFANITEELDEQMAPNEYMILCSLGWRKDFNKLIREGDGTDFIQDDRASIIFSQFNGGVQAVDFDVDRVKYLGYTFNIKAQRAFSDPTQYKGITKYQDFALGLPMGEANIYEELGAQPTTVPSMNVVYKKDGFGGDRALVEEMQTMKETGEDAFEHILLTEGGIEVNAVNHCFTMNGDASS